MGFGGIRFARSTGSFGIVLVLFSAGAFNASAQQLPAAPSGAPVSNLPTAVPNSQAAVRSYSLNTDSAKPTATGASTGIDMPEQQAAALFRLGPGDLIEISVYNVAELSAKARVGNSGDIYLPLIDYVHLGGLTVEEAQKLIQKRLEDGGFVRDAHVTLFVDESSSQGVTILGEVARPGIYPSTGERKLYDFISAAGGFSQAAGRKVSVIRQSGDSGPITLTLPRNLADDLKDDIRIFPGDTISVARAPIVYVVGDVGHPAGLLVDNGSLTVLQALALTGGANHTAKMSGVRIIRKGPAGMTETRVPLKKILEAKSPDLTLQADDILFVPLSGVRQVASEGLSAAVSAASGLAVLAAHP
jgi:polysaccharide biosynthesis/export protein